MAIVALQCGMGSDQREAVLMVLYILNGDVPALHRMALFAARSHLAAVDVSMTVSALVSYVAEHRLGVALRTGNTLVHAAQRVTGLIVIELGNGANRFPTDRRMTIL